MWAGGRGSPGLEGGWGVGAGDRTADCQTLRATRGRYGVRRGGVGGRGGVDGEGERQMAVGGSSRGGGWAGLGVGLSLGRVFRPCPGLRRQLGEGGGGGRGWRGSVGDGADRALGWRHGRGRASCQSFLLSALSSRYSTPLHGLLGFLLVGASDRTAEWDRTPEANRGLQCGLNVTRWRPSRIEYIRPEVLGLREPGPFTAW